MTDILQPPPEHLLQVCDTLEELVGEVIDAKNAAASKLRRFEAPVEAAIQLNLVIRNLEAVVALARHDLVLLPAAIVLTRSAFEGGLRSWWMLSPSDDFEREARWLAHLAEEEEMWERLARLTRDTGEPVGDYSEAAQNLFTFRAAVASKMPSSIRIPDRLPNLRTIAKEMGEERRYTTYVLLSQYTHAGHFAGQTYRRGLGVRKEFGEHTSPAQWATCIRIGWWALFRASHRLVEIAGVPGLVMGRTDGLANLERSLKAVESLEQ